MNSPLRKTTLEYDPEQEAEVERILGTKGLTATVRQSFARVIAEQRRQSFLDLVQSGACDFSVLGEAWGE